MLESVPYKAPEKKSIGKAKGVWSGPHRKGTSNAASEDNAHSPTAEDDADEEEEETDSPPTGGGRRGRPPQLWRRRRPKRGRAP